MKKKIFLMILLLISLTACNNMSEKVTGKPDTGENVEVPKTEISTETGNGERGEMPKTEVSTETDIDESNETQKAEVSLSDRDVAPGLSSDMSDLEKKIYTAIYAYELTDERKYIEKYGKRENAEALVPAVVLSICDIKKNKDGYRVLLYADNRIYALNGGIFDESSGSVTPKRYDLNGDFTVVSVKEARDGSEYNPSIVEMADGDEALASKWIGEFDNNLRKENDKKLILELKKNAEFMGLKNITYDIKNIPGYETDVKYIDIPETDFVNVIKNDDYNALQEERKTIVPSDQAGPHWVYRECVLYDKSTGICLKDILDYSD